MKTIVVFVLLLATLAPSLAYSQVALNQFKFTAPGGNLLGQAVKKVKSRQGVLLYEIQPQAYNADVLADTISSAGIDTVSLDQTLQNAFNITLASGNRSTKLVLHAKKIRTVFLGPTALQSADVMASDKSLIVGVMVAGRMTADLTQQANSTVNYKKIASEASTLLTPVGAGAAGVGEVLKLVGGLDSVHTKKNLKSVAHWEGHNLAFAIVTMRVRGAQLLPSAKVFHPELPNAGSPPPQFQMALGEATSVVQPLYGGIRLPGARNGYVNTKMGRSYQLAYVRVNEQGEPDAKGQVALVVQMPQTVRARPRPGQLPKPAYPIILAAIPPVNSGPEGDSWLGSHYLIDSQDIGNGTGKLLVYLDIKASQKHQDVTKLYVTQGNEVGETGMSGDWDTCLSYVEYYFDNAD